MYRYLLTFRNKQVASLFDESLFVEAYLYLFQVRYGQNLQVLMQLEEAHLHKRIPPLSLQLLVENAVKHNSISTSEPLSIKIYISEQQFLVIENNRNPKITPEESTGLGLQNIAQRYELLGLPDAVAVHQTAHVFQVTIPLIEDEN